MVPARSRQSPGLRSRPRPVDSAEEKRMELEQALTAIERAKNVAELSAMLFDWRDESGVAHLVYHAVQVPASGKPNPLLLPTYDEVWVKRYVERDYFQIDPVLRAGRKGFLPIDWLTVEHDTVD